MVVLFSALIGLAVSTAYKYADAVVKEQDAVGVRAEGGLLNRWKSGNMRCPVFQRMD
jgi:hypothetical protein